MKINFNNLEKLQKNLRKLILEVSLKNGGHMLICVPSFMSLYSEFDRIIGHFKRYEKKRF